MKIEVNIKKKYFYVLLVLIILIVGIEIIIAVAPWDDSSHTISHNSADLSVIYGTEETDVQSAINDLKTILDGTDGIPGPQGPPGLPGPSGTTFAACVNGGVHLEDNGWKCDYPCSCGDAVSISRTSSACTVTSDTGSCSATTHIDQYRSCQGSCCVCRDAGEGEPPTGTFAVCVNGGVHIGEHGRECDEQCSCEGSGLLSKTTSACTVMSSAGSCSATTYSDRYGTCQGSCCICQQSE